MDAATLAAGAAAQEGAGLGLAGMLVTAADPTAAAIALPALLELAAVVTGGVSGALEASAKHLDIMGVCTLALVTAFGGGLIRDVILPTDRIYMLDNPSAVLVCVAAGLAAFFFSGLLYKLDKPIAVFDIVSVGAFTVAGADKALMLGYGFVPCVLMGILTGVGGGTVRDICLGNIPNIFKSGNYYAVCSLAGAMVYYSMVELHIVKVAAAVAAVVVVVGLRWLSLRYNLITAAAVDLTPKVMGPLRQLLHHGKVVTRPAGGDPQGILENWHEKNQPPQEDPNRPDQPDQRA